MTHKYLSVGVKVIYLRRIRTTNNEIIFKPILYTLLRVDENDTERPYLVRNETEMYETWLGPLFGDNSKWIKYDDLTEHEKFCFALSGKLPNRLMP